MPKSRLGALSEMKIQMDASLSGLRERLVTFTSVDETLPGRGFQGELRPYQQEGVSWLAFLYEFGLHGILADDMGLGKTVQVLAFLSQLETEQPILIVMPTSLIFSWKREIERFLPEAAVIVHHGPERPREVAALQRSGIILTTYTTLRLDSDLLAQVNCEVLVLDEAQAIKNSRTQTFQAACKLHARLRLSLTGTPLENHLGELWAHFHFLIPDLFGDEKEFASELQAAEVDLRHLNRIKKKIRPFLLRRKKAEVARDLPEKIEQVVWVEMAESQRRIYEQFLSGVRKKVQAEGMGKSRMEVLEALLRLRQICCHPLLLSGQLEEEVFESAKMEALLQDLEQVVEEGRKALVYSQFTSLLSLVGKQLRERNIPYAYLDGSTTNREEIVNRFQEDAALPLFLISLKAGGVGLNLTSADYVFLYDPWWNEAAENQAIDRAHRIGRKETVIAKRYVTVESVEEKMMKLKEHKRSLGDHLLDEDAGNASLTADDLLFLIL